MTNNRKLECTAIFGNWKKPGMADIVNRISRFLIGKGVKVLIEPGGERLLEATLAKKVGTTVNAICSADMIFSVGGDGTLLRVVRETVKWGSPVLGINTGTLGFLTEIDSGSDRELEEGLERIVRNEYKIDRRMRISAESLRTNGEIEKFTALNEVVILRNSFSRMAELEVFINGEYLTTYFTDGLILSTPTGSTAHSLSAGGPVMMPEQDAFLIIPICPHSLSVRSIMIPGSYKVTVIFRSKRQGGVGTVDGQQTFELSFGDEVRLERASKDAMLVRIWGRSFFDVMRRKFNWGGAVRGE